MIPIVLPGLNHPAISLPRVDDSMSVQIVFIVSDFHCGKNLLKSISTRQQWLFNRSDLKYSRRRSDLKSTSGIISVCGTGWTEIDRDTLCLRNRLSFGRWIGKSVLRIFIGPPWTTGFWGKNKNANGMPLQLRWNQCNWVGMAVFVAFLCWHEGTLNIQWWCLW